MAIQTPAPEHDAHPEELPLLVVLAAKALVADATSRLDRPAEGLTVSHALAARFVAGRTDATAAELAEHLHVTKQSASEIVATLEKGGYLRRRPHPDDGRVRVLVLTASGRQGLARSEARWAQIEREWAERAGAADLAAVRRALAAYLGT